MRALISSMRVTLLLLICLLNSVALSSQRVSKRLKGGQLNQNIDAVLTALSAHQAPVADQLQDNDNEESPSNGMDRRKALITTGITALSLWTGSTGKALPTWAETGGFKVSPPKTILVTGCNSGIGFEAARILARQGNTIIMACRTLAKAQEAADKIKAETLDANLIPAECDLASQASIRDFVKDIKLENLDVVCYNAGVALNTDDPEIQRTKEGFELTVGTNHLGHFYLQSLLLPKIRPDTGKIVITASAVHDPDSPGGAQGKLATLGNLEGFIRQGKNFEMVDGQSYNGDKAYKDSKLCNVFFCRELQRRLSASDATKGITVNSFSPGLITSTGLFRYQSPLFSSIFGVLATNVLKVAESPEWGGAALAYMTTVNTQGEYYNSPPGSSKYGEAAFGREFSIYAVSKEAQDDNKGKKLWELSEKLVGI
ncbi:light-dependent protochlorophyllide oxido-reductase [Nitzschia inconspicua]|uniref:Light-dependent protochlorophyllide oxido-reductase n=1 Tax=Nitzschia inconspicua TaxID=303405 RepID=A0A9K3KP99_9STRA|nr:light-dependent protochlorophyllide oxido-reductase [Nitzschia inconspicua]